jgi:hypothetical protein
MEESTDEGGHSSRFLTIVLAWIVVCLVGFLIWFGYWGGNYLNDKLVEYKQKLALLEVSKSIKLADFGKVEPGKKGQKGKIAELSRDELEKISYVLKLRLGDCQYAMDNVKAAVQSAEEQ